jgi:prepilin-type N-terminal cleavage/methylation domain-containing protein
MSRRRSGFTLLELVVAIVVTGVVALLAYATLRAGVDTNERLERSEAGVSAQAVARALLLDAIRHPPEEGGAAMNEALFTLEDRTSATGMPGDLLTFFSQGVGRAPGTAGLWLVTLGATEEGVRLRAAPVDPDAGAAFDVMLPEARGLDARVLARSPEDAWMESWDLLGRVPAAVRIDLLDVSGRPLGPPVIAHAALEAVP